MPGPHPDDDLLADLAADVLPAAEARQVEAHVMACEECSALLADAERLRGLLLTDDPGPMPADVWARIEAALAVPAETHQPTARAPWQDDDADPLDTPDRWDGPLPAPRPPATAGVRHLPVSRRDSRLDRPRARRPLAWVVGAAAALLVGAVVAGVHASWAGGGGSSGGGGAALADGSASSSAAAAGAGRPGEYLASGTEYTKSGLAKQARALAARTQPGAAGGSATAGPSAPAPSAVAPRAAEGGGPSSPNAPAAREPSAPDPSATDVTNPADLAGCLQSLKTSPDRLVAVDLASYQGREAAVILLHAPSGGYEVFVVERTCSSADDHTLAYLALQG